MNNTIWAEDITQLLSFQIIPKSSQNTTENLNALTRLALLACIVIAIFKPVLAVSTFLIVSIILLAIYYGCSFNREGYSGTTDTIGLAGDLFKASHKFPLSRNRFCNDVNPLQFDEEFFSKNQMLVGGPNPKTLIPPIIAPPSHDLSEWKATDLVVQSSINDDTNYDAANSGYIGPAFNFNKDYSGYVNRRSNLEELPPICSECRLAPCRCDNAIPSRSDQLRTATIQPGVYERSDFLEPINSLIGISEQKQFDPTRITSSNRNGILYATENYPYSIKTPSPSITDDNDDDGDEYPQYDRLIENHRNKNHHPIKKNHIKENFITTDADGGDSSSLPTIKLLQTESDIYDPRFTGYGPVNRSYIEPMTGSPRFFYDDINAVNMPNFISRNNVDIYPWAPQYGSGMNGNLSENGIGHGDGYKRLAEDAFMNATLKFRTEMQERLLRKRNAELWQTRLAPIHTMG